MSLRNSWIRLKGEIARPLRRGSRFVYSTPDRGRGFGNFLYYWLRAEIEQSRGRDYRVLHAPAMEPWLAELPAVRERLVIGPGDLRFSDRRIASESTWVDRFGTDFSREQLHGFIGEYLIGSALLGARRTAEPRVLVVNVRRGDYYSDLALRGFYGFDIQGYIETALPLAAASRGPIDTVRVVSDDVEWCQVKLDRIIRGYSGEIDYCPATDSPQENFRRVANASRIVGTNSTFTYWAGYVSNVLHGSDSQVVMPDFHARHLNGGRAYQLDPEWDIVGDIPGGWDA